MECREAEAETVDERAATIASMQQEAGETSYETNIQVQCLNAYAKLQYEKLVDRTCIQKNIKEEFVEPLVKSMKQEVLRRLKSTVKDGMHEIETVIEQVFDVHRGIENTCERGS